MFEDSGQDFQHSQIWLENADGSNVRQVVSDDSRTTARRCPRTARRSSSTGCSPIRSRPPIADPSLFGTLTVVNTDGSDLHEVDTADRAKRCDVAPEGDAWSPDGSRIAYVRYCFDKQAQLGRGGASGRSRPTAPMPGR